MSCCRIAWHKLQKYLCKEWKPCVKWINDNNFLAISDFWSEMHWERARVSMCSTHPKTGTGTGTSDIFGRLRTSDFFGNLQKWSCRLQKNLSTPRIKISRPTYISEKVGRHRMSIIALDQSSWSTLKQCSVDTQWTLIWHLGSTLVRSQLIFIQCIWVSRHLADYWPAVDQVLIECQASIDRDVDQNIDRDVN